MPSVSCDYCGRSVDPDEEEIRCSSCIKLCTVHADSEHGWEAEELRHGLEELIKGGDDVSAKDIQRLLDRVDACDSLAYLERAKAEGGTNG